MPVINIETYHPKAQRTGTIRLMPDAKMPGHISMSCPPFHVMTQNQAIELAHALADLVEELR